jgi:hypothetical protein
MNAFLAQVIVTARNRGTEGWVQILVFVVLAVVYVLGSILKAKSSKTEQEKKNPLTRQPPRKPPQPASRTQTPPFRQARRPVGPVQHTEYQPQRQPVPRKVSRPQPTAAKPATQEQPTPYQPLEMPELSLQRPQLESRIEELPEFASQTLQKMQARAQPLDVAARTPVAKDVSQPVLDYTDADELTRAIFHYEILGRPLSLRDPSQRIIGF